MSAKTHHTHALESNLILATNHMHEEDINGRLREQFEHSLFDLIRSQKYLTLSRLKLRNSAHFGSLAKDRPRGSTERQLI